MANQSSEKLAQYLVNASVRFKRTIARGLAQIVELTPSRSEALLPHIADFLTRGLPPDEDDAHELAIDRSELLEMTAAVSVLLEALKWNLEDAAIRSVLVTQKACDEGTSQKLPEFLQLLRAHQSKIEKSLQLNRLAGEVLPTLTSFHVRIDIRLKIEKGAVVISTPVAIAYLDTDASDQQVWFQMSKTQLERFRKRIDEVWDEINVAEGWSQKLDPPPEGDETCS